MSLPKSSYGKINPMISCPADAVSYPAGEVRPWLPPGKRAAICFTVDDVHPGRSTDAFEAGGDLAQGALGHIDWLLCRHAHLHCTLFVTPDWRQVRPHAHRGVLSRIPMVRDRVYLSRPLPLGSMRLDRHPGFVRYLATLPRTDVALHGLHHLRRGPLPLVEFRGLSQRQCNNLLRRAMRIFHRAGLLFSPGVCPPAWHFSDNLGEAMIHNGLRWVASARDLETPIHRCALTGGSGLTGVSLLYPQTILGGRLVHIPTNFQATSSIDRAIAVIEAGGLVSVKAHISKYLPGHTLLDGMDIPYRNYLDRLFTEVDRRYGDSLWWPSMDDIAARVCTSPQLPNSLGMPTHAAVFASHG